nr:PAS domain-containing protein [Caulobacter sp. RHG1]
MLFVLLAIAARMAAVALTGVAVNFPPFFVAVMVAAMVGGLGPGTLALALSALVAWRFWLAPDDSWTPHLRETVQLSMFLLCGGLIVVLVEALRLAVRSGFAAEERFRSAQEVSLDAFVILEPMRQGGQVVDFRWTYANPMADSMRPAGVPTLLGRRVLEVFPDATGQDMVERFRRLLEAGGPDDIDVRRIIDGEERWVRSSGVRLGGDIAVTFRDVTQERQAAAALRSSEELFRGMANSAPVLIWATNADGQPDWFNQAWLDFRGGTLEQELAGDWFDSMHSDDRTAALDVADAAARRRETFHVAFRLRRADGAWRWINSVGAPRFDASGAYAGHIGSSFDFTETVEARRDLEHRVIERTAGGQHGRNGCGSSGAGSGPAAGDRWPADRRRGARLQQPADGGRRRPGHDPATAGRYGARHAAGRSGAGGGPTRRAPDPAAAGLFTPSGTEAGSGRYRRPAGPGRAAAASRGR